MGEQRRNRLRWSGLARACAMLGALAFVVGVTAGCSEMMKKAASEEKPDKEAVAKAEKAPAPRIQPMTHIAAGQMLEGQGDFPKAIEQYEKAVSANPKFVTAYNRLGIVYQKMQRFEEAEAILKRGIQADPSASILHNNLGICYLVREKYDEAQRSFEKALLISPRFKRARMNLGIVLARKNEVQKSAEAFSCVVAADAAYYNVALIRMGQKDYAGAETAFRNALRINPGCPGAKEQLDRVVWITGGQPYEPKGPGEFPETSLAGTAEEDAGDAP